MSFVLAAIGVPLAQATALAPAAGVAQCCIPTAVFTVLGVEEEFKIYSQAGDPNGLVCR